MLGDKKTTQLLAKRSVLGVMPRKEWEKREKNDFKTKHQAQQSAT